MYSFRPSGRSKTRRVAVLYVERDGKRVEFASAEHELQVAHLRRKEKELKEEGVSCWFEYLQEAT